MANDDLKLLFDAIKAEILNSDSSLSANADEEAFFQQLVSDTLQFRDKMKEQTGYMVTVEDTQIALKALESHINGKKFPDDLTSRQKALAVILIDRYIIFKHHLNQ